MSIDLLRYMNEHFPGLELDGGLFYRWPVGIRFDLDGHPECGELKTGEVVTRASDLYAAYFHADDHCVLIAQDCPGEEQFEGHATLFATLGARFGVPQGGVAMQRQSDAGASDVTLHWHEGPACGIPHRDIFLGIARLEHALVPAISSRVYFLNPEKHVIMHMYDDRGLDVIALDPDVLRGLYEGFSSWILEYDRIRIDGVFGAVRGHKLQSDQ